ncbi:MAG: glutaminyl-peptide cyclotransferase [Clostridia bacterium]|nr:glutaminyl-peptide cyclotransferase [Clostridia bacterium]
MSKITSFFTTLILIISYIFGAGSNTVSDGYRLVRKEKMNSVTSMYTAQGLCCDGEFFYGSGALTAINFTGLAKFDLGMKCVKKVKNAVPKEFYEKYGSNHIGGIDCAGGKIYASVEGKIKGQGYVYNFILLYDCETLEYTGTYYDLTSDYLTDGIAWCAIDRDAGLLYTSKFKDVTEILRYDLETMEFLGTFPLQEEVTRIQGGSVYEGILYLSYDASDSCEEQILRIDPADGSVSVEFTRYLPNYDNEAEDICVYPLPDGTLFHTVDYDKLVNANFMHYAKT